MNLLDILYENLKGIIKSCFFAIMIITVILIFKYFSPHSILYKNYYNAEIIINDITAYIIILIPFFIITIPIIINIIPDNFYIRLFSGFISYLFILTAIFITVYMLVLYQDIHELKDYKNGFFNTPFSIVIRPSYDKKLSLALDATKEYENEFIIIEIENKIHRKIIHIGSQIDKFRNSMSGLMFNLFIFGFGAIYFCLIGFLKKYYITQSSYLTGIVKFNLIIIFNCIFYIFPI